MPGLSPTPPTTRGVFKNMLKGSGLYMVAMAAPAFLSLVLVPIVTKRLTTADYGVLDLLQQVATVTTFLLGVNFSSTLGYFYFAPDAEKSRVVSTALSGALLVGALGGSLGLVLANPISRLVFHSAIYVPYLRLVFAALPLGFLYDAGLAWLRAEERSLLFTGTVLLRLTIVLTGTLTLLLGLHLRIGAVLGANIMAASICGLTVAGAAIRFHGVRLDQHLFRRMWRFSMPLSLSALALFLIHFGDRFVLPHYRPFADLGIYAVAYKLGMLLNPVQAAFEAYWTAQVYQIVRRPDAEIVFARTFTYLMLVMSVCGLGVLVGTQPALRIMTPPAYFRAAAIVPIILAAYYIRALGDFFRIVFLAKGLPTHDAACNWITASFCVTAYFVLIPRYGIQGAAVATFLSFVVAFVISYTWSYRVWPFRLELGRIAKLLAITVALAAVQLALPPSSIAIEIARGVGLLLIFAALLFLWRFLSPGEKELLRSAPGRLAGYSPW